MTYKEWAEEYSESAKILKVKIKNLKDELKNAPVSTIMKINARINIMYQMYLECVKTADILSARKDNR